MKKLRIWIRCKKDDLKSLNIALSLGKKLERKGHEVFFHAYIGKRIEKIKDRILDEEVIDKNRIDTVIVIGGDGTLLHVIHKLLKRSPRILGINVESVGFLYDYDYHEIDRVIDLLEKDMLSVKYRNMGQVVSTDKKFSKDFFLNEVAIFNKDFFKILRFKLMLDDMLLYEGRADAIIVSTTTGSTAYALSAGGPIIDEKLECFVVVPVAPFSVLLKPTVVSAERKIKIIPENDVIAIIDGFKKVILYKETEIEISRSEISIPFLTGHTRKDFSMKIRNRFLDKVWSYSYD